MPSHAAMIEKPVTLSPDILVEKALKDLKKRKIDAAAVVNEDGTLNGVFSIGAVMRNLLPVSVAMSDGIKIDLPVRAAPGIAKRLKKLYPLTVGELMDKKPLTVYPDTPIWECVSGLVSHGGPLFVIDHKDHKFLGMIDMQSAFHELQRLQESGE